MAETQGVGISKSPVPAPDGNPGPGTRSPSRVGMSASLSAASPLFLMPQFGAFCWLMREQWLWERVGAHGGCVGCVILPDRKA